MRKTIDTAAAVLAVVLLIDLAGWYETGRPPTPKAPQEVLAPPASARPPRAASPRTRLTQLELACGVVGAPPWFPARDDKFDVSIDACDLAPGVAAPCGGGVVAVVGAADSLGSPARETARALRRAEVAAARVRRLLARRCPAAEGGPRIYLVNVGPHRAPSDTPIAQQRRLFLFFADVFSRPGDRAAEAAALARMLRDAGLFSAYAQCEVSAPGGGGRALGDCGSGARR